MPFKAHENQLKIREALKFPYFIIICSYSLRREWALCLCSGTMYKQPTKHTTPLHRTIVVTFFSVVFLFFLFFVVFFCSLSFTRFLLHVNKQANNATTIEYTNYFCWLISPCLSGFSIVCIKRQTERYIHYVSPFICRIFLCFFFYFYPFLNHSFVQVKISMVWLNK